MTVCACTICSSAVVEVARSWAEVKAEVHRGATEELLKEAWTSAMDRLFGNLGKPVKYVTPFAPTEFGVIQDMDLKWVYVRYDSGSVHKTCPVNLQLDTSANLGDKRK